MRVYLVSVVLLLWIAGNPLWAGKSRYIVKYENGGLFKTRAYREARVLIEAESSREAVEKAHDRGLSVMGVEEDRMLYPVSTLDPFTHSQWALHSSQGIDMNEAWERTVGDASTVIAVIDSGILQHEDLAGRLLQGADFISDADNARDGDGRDLNPRDEGDYTLSGQLCPGDFFPKNSSWHGTHVAGSIAANVHNNKGIAGVDQKAMILPIRALGTCGGTLFDISEAIRWAAGGSVNGMPANEHPADVINLSLGGFGACTDTIQAAIDYANDQGAVVVVAAGNESSNLDWTPFVPATCRGVITVGASNRVATYTWYSNRGESVDVTAPGGDSEGGIVSLSNIGMREPEADDYRNLIGTSMAAPHVAGVVGLIKAINPGLYPPQVEDVLKRSTVAVDCPLDQCGTGLINAREALVLAAATEPDPSFRAYEPIVSSFPPAPIREPSNLGPQEEEASGGCGTVDFNGGGGPGGSPKQFVLYLLLGVLVGLLSHSIKGKTLQR